MTADELAGDRTVGALFLAVEDVDAGVMIDVPAPDGRLS